MTQLAISVAQFATCFNVFSLSFAAAHDYYQFHSRTVTPDTPVPDELQLQRSPKQPLLLAFLATRGRPSRPPAPARRYGSE